MAVKPHKWQGPLPSASPETKPFWDACDEGVFLLQRCQDCGQTQYHYRAFCCHCWSDRIEDFPSGGAGTVWTYSVVQKNRSPAFAGRVPYAVVLVELEGGVKVFGNLVDCDYDLITIGMPVELVFAEAAENRSVPVFVPASGSQPVE